MKKIILGLILVMLMLFNQSVLADSKPTIEAKVNGTVDQGQKIQILINIKDISSFYAAQMEFKYDTSVLKIDSIEQGDLISKAGVNKFDALNKVDAENGTASYAFSCLGKINGFSGSGTFLKINAEVLKKDSFHINSKPFLKQSDKDMNLKLQIVNSDINEVDYQFVPYVFATGSAENPSNNGTTGSNTGTNISADNSSSSNSTNTAKTDDKNEPDKSKENNSQTAVNSSNSDTGKDGKQRANKPADSAASSKELSSEKANNMKIYAALLLVLILIAGAGVYYVLKNKKRNDINDKTDVNM